MIDPAVLSVRIAHLCNTNAYLLNPLENTKNISQQKSTQFDRYDFVVVVEKSKFILPTLSINLMLTL